MAILRFGRHALSSAVAAAFLAGCGGGSQPPAATAAAALQNPAIAAHFKHVGSWIARSGTSGDLLYATLGDTVGIYSLSGKQVGELKGFDFEAVYGLCSDSQGNVWVTYGDSLLEYARGGTIPIAQIYMPSGAAYSCAVDPTTGDIAATEYSDEGGDNVVVYQGIYATPTTYTDSDLSFYAFCTYDDQGNLFVNGTRGKYSPLAELPSGGSTLGTIKLDRKITRLGGLQWDGQYLAMGDSLAHVVYRFSVANGNATTQSTTHFSGWFGHFKTIEPFAIGDSLIVLTFSKRQTGFWKWPAGGSTVRRLPVVTGAKTISVAPSALHGGKR